MIDKEKLERLLDIYEIDVLIIIGIKNSFYVSQLPISDGKMLESADSNATGIINFVIAFPDKSFSVGSVPREIGGLRMEHFPVKKANALISPRIMPR